MFDEKTYHREYMRLWRQENREKVKESNRKQREKDKEAYQLYQREYIKKWKSEHPEQAKAIADRFNEKRRGNREYLDKKKQDVILNPEKYKKRWRAHTLKKKFGLTVEQYEDLLYATDGRCPICERTFTEKGDTKPCVDHCHKANHVRGIICFGCNVAEGALKTPERALRLYEYMKRNELFYQGSN